MGMMHTKCTRMKQKLCAFLHLENHGKMWYNKDTVKETRGTPHNQKRSIS
jgi:hypothetical protein